MVALSRRKHTPRLLSRQTCQTSTRRIQGAPICASSSLRPWTSSTLSESELDSRAHNRSDKIISEAGYVLITRIKIVPENQHLSAPHGLTSSASKYLNILQILLSEKSLRYYVVWNYPAW